MKNASTFLGLISAGILTLSVAYDFGYLFRFGVSFAEAPTTLSDHIRSSLVWIPSVVFTVFSLVVVRWSFRRRNIEETAKQMSGPPKYLYLALLVPAIHFLVTPVPLLLWTMLVSLGWYVLHDRIFRNLGIQKKAAQKLYLPTFACPPIIILAAALGYHNASLLIAGAGNEHVFTINGQERQVTLARHFEKYFLVWDKDKSRAEFIATDSVGAFYQTNGEKESNEARKHPGDAEEMPKGVEK
ncbi:MAG: hypothetical protein OD918_11065 [Gammaproteobacteria bacterium]